MASTSPTKDYFVRINLSQIQNLTVIIVNTFTALELEWWHSYEEYSTIEAWIYVAIFVLGLFGNSLVIVAVLVDKNMRNPMNILIVSLAVADVLFLMLHGLAKVSLLFKTDWGTGDFSCRVKYYAKSMSLYASVYMLVLMSFYRYLVVVHPIRFKIWASVQNTRIVVVVLWVVILCLNTPIIFLTGTQTYEDLESNGTVFTTCGYTDSFGSYYIVCTLDLLSAYIIPLGIIVVLYGLILKRLHSGVVPGDGNQSAERMRKNMRVTRMVIIVVAVFALCWLPYQLFVITTVLDISYNFSRIYFTTAVCLYFLNSCINPILYTFLSQNFRQRFRKLLCRHSSSSPAGQASPHRCDSDR